MNVHLSYYNLDSYGNIAKETVPGDKVCPANGCTSIGVITQVKRAKEYSYGEGKQYVILWLTGKKAGKTTEHPGVNLTSIKHYLAACQRQMDDVQAMIEEANKFGL